MLGGGELRRLSRRRFLGETAACAGALLVKPALCGAESAARGARPKVAAICTEFTYRSHAHVIFENFLEPYLFNGKLHSSPVEIASVFIDQFPQKEMGRQVAKEYGLPIYETIGQALCLGGDELAVDAVLSIGEQGNYPLNTLAQREYPRKRFFDEAVAVMRRSKKFVPFFNDKHLSYRWDWAKEMYDTARELGMPLMAGSSVPLAQRRPPLEVPSGAEIADIVVVQGGPLEAYDFHGLEVLQSLVEDRQAGETGISEVEFLAGDALFKAADEGRWSLELAEAALGAEGAVRKVPLRELIRQPPRAILVRYKDGLQATVLSVGYSGVRWDAALRFKGDDRAHATYFYGGPWNNRGLFRALSHAIQQFFVERKSPYPVERTLLVTGALDAAMHSRAEGKALPTPQLEFGYAAVDFRPLREMGATWGIIGPETPEPKWLKKDPAPPAG